MICRLFKKKEKYQPIICDVYDEEYIKNFIYEWDLRYPLDRWYRQKHNLSFDSIEHRRVSFFSMRLAWEEYKVFNEIKFKYYEKDKGDWLDVSDLNDDHLSDEEKMLKYKKEFEEIDLSKYND